MFSIVFIPFTINGFQIKNGHVDRIRHTEIALLSNYAIRAQAYKNLLIENDESTVEL